MNNFINFFYNQLLEEMECLLDDSGQREKYEENTLVDISSQSDFERIMQKNLITNLRDW